MRIYKKGKSVEIKLTEPQLQAIFRAFEAFAARVDIDERQGKITRDVLSAHDAFVKARGKIVEVADYNSVAAELCENLKTALGWIEEIFQMRGMPPKKVQEDFVNMVNSVRKFDGLAPLKEVNFRVVSPSGKPVEVPDGE